MQTHTVEGGGGLKLHVRECGPQTARAILFIHGWSQNHLCWSRQFESFLADTFRLVALDLRGHGQSEAPLDAESYSTGALWADDVRNVIDALQLDRPVLVGWSYAGFIISDYVRRYGDADIAGINFVGASVGSGKRWLNSHIGSRFLECIPPACSEDQTVALKAIREFLHVCLVKPIAAEDVELAMGWNMLVHPTVRKNLLRRQEDFTPDLAMITKPVLTTYGDADAVMLPAMAQAIRDHVPDCRVSEYPGVGHMPFLEEPDRFNAELGAFARECFRTG